MTIYRKLASSSIVALQTALKRRLERINLNRKSYPPEYSWNQNLELESDELPDWDIEDAARRFFSDEDAVLIRLIAACNEANQDDRKIHVLFAAVNEWSAIRNQKVLIFTEYRATQDYLASQLHGRGYPSVLINGSQSIDEKIRSVRQFEDAIPILISTEAGGEGFNLHRNCSFLINYDLPWNPARLIQRIGRLYRYGQIHRVKVLNLQAKDTIDNEILDTALQKVQTIVDEMAPISSEFADGYRTEVLGELLEQLDLSDILGTEDAFEIERTRDRIDEAISRARRARELQSEILDNAGRFNPNELTRLGSFTTRHVAEFVKRSAPFLGIAVEPYAHHPERFRLRLPDELRGRFSDLGGRTVLDATTNRRNWSGTDAQILLDFSSPLFQHLIEQTTSPAFGGSYAALAKETLQCSMLAAFLCRWQNDQGDRLDQQLVIAKKAEGGLIEIANDAIARLFDAPISTLDSPSIDAEVRKEFYEAVLDRVEIDMAASITRFRHPNDLVLLAIGESGQSRSTPA